MARDRKGQGASWPGSESARVLLADSLRGANWPGSEKARYLYSTQCYAYYEYFNEMFFQLITLCPHPHFTCHIAKKIRKPAAFYTFENPQIRILSEAILKFLFDHNVLQTDIRPNVPSLKTYVTKCKYHPRCNILLHWRIFNGCVAFTSTGFTLTRWQACHHQTAFS